MRNKIGFAFAGITAGLITLFTATTSASGAPTHRNDCDIVRKADRLLCERVKLQHPYGAAYGDGGWSAPGGKVIVHEITHQGLTAREMHDYLVMEADDYRLWVTGVPVNMDDIVRKCGNTDGQWVVGFRDEDGKPGGVKLTVKKIRCA